MTGVHIKGYLINQSKDGSGSEIGDQVVPRISGYRFTWLSSGTSCIWAGTISVLPGLAQKTAVSTTEAWR
jgi:hypothetical protein